MVKAIIVNRETRGGIPAFLNDRIAIRNFLATGYSYEDAVDWSAAGCLSYVVSHCNLASKIAAYIIIPKVFVEPSANVTARLVTLPLKYTFASRVMVTLLNSDIFY